MNTQALSVIEALSTKNEEGTVTAFDLETLDTVIAELRSARKEIAANNKEAAKAEKTAANAELAKAGKAYYDSLAVGDLFTYKTANGTVLKARKIETKSNSGQRPSYELIECSTKSAKRYPEFYQVIVP